MNQLIQLPTNALLDKFGSGTHAPGSGSAAALMGLLSAKLINTVAVLSLKKEEYRPHYSTIEYIQNDIREQIEPALKEIFERDAKVFDEVIKLRIARDSAADEREKRRLGEKALERLKEATEIPIQIGNLCTKLIDHGGSMFDIGFKAARGDTGAAISAAVAGTMAGIFVTNLNLKSFRGSEWAKEKRRECDALHKTLEAKQIQAYQRVMTLRSEDISTVQFDLDI